MNGQFYAFVGIALAISFIVMAIAYGISKIASKAVESMARQPQAAQSISSAMFLPCTFIEGAGIFSVIICLIIALTKL